ncbi:MAG: hypothetical protein EAX81_00050 [Candidatus Thorarchaeota archaeon]|nr:hypothetical protein [Candidatus Thorarchaeota archaeon]
MEQQPKTSFFGVAKYRVAIRFLTRLAKGEGHYHVFYVPKYVRDFYNLRPGSYMGGITLANGISAGYRIDFSSYRRTLRGRVPESAGSSKDIVEVWMYPDTWRPRPIASERGISAKFMGSLGLTATEKKRSLQHIIVV